MDFRCLRHCRSLIIFVQLRLCFSSRDTGDSGEPDYVSTRLSILDSIYLRIRSPERGYDLFDYLSVWKVGGASGRLSQKFIKPH